MKSRKFIAGVCALSMLGTVASVSVSAQEIPIKEEIANSISSEKFDEVKETTEVAVDEEAEETEITADEEVEETEIATDEAEEETEAAPEERPGHAHGEGRPEGIPEERPEIVTEETTEETDTDESEEFEEPEFPGWHGDKEWHFGECEFDKEFDEFREFMMNHHEWQNFRKPWFVIEVDENGDKAFRPEFEEIMDEFGNIIENMPEFDENGCPKMHRFLGFDEEGKKIFGENEKDKLIVVEEDGTITDATAEIVDEAKELYKTINIKKGRPVLVKHEKADEDDTDADIENEYVELENGDANADNSVDVKDITLIAQKIVKITEIPEYMITADVDNNDEVDIKDLAQLKRYLIKDIETL